MKPKRINWYEVEGIADPKVLTGEIARRLGCSKEAVRAARRKLGLAHPDPNALAKGPTIDWDQVPDLLSAPSASLARRLGVSERGVDHAKARRAVRAVRALAMEIALILACVIIQLAPGAR